MVQDTEQPKMEWTILPAWPGTTAVVVSLAPTEQVDPEDVSLRRTPIIGWRVRYIDDPSVTGQACFRILIERRCSEPSHIEPGNIGLRSGESVMALAAPCALCTPWTNIVVGGGAVIAVADLPRSLVCQPRRQE